MGRLRFRPNRRAIVVSTAGRRGAQCEPFRVADRLSVAARSENMRRIRSKNTSPEVAVRQYLHSRGLRFRLHGNLPGRPDIVFPKKRVCVFVHGCFWHGCSRCIDGTRAVKSNSQYWRDKVQNNAARDERNAETLRASGWHVIEIWGCQIRDRRMLGRIATRVKNIR